MNMQKFNGMIILVILTAWIAVWPAAAQENAQVYLTPVSSTADTVTVDVMVENVTNLYGVEFLLSYDPAVVSVADARPEQDGAQIVVGSLLPVEQGFVVANQANPDTGAISFAMTLLNPAPAVSGSGPLAQITFKQLQSSPSTVEIADIKLVADSLQIIPAQTTGLTLGEDLAAAVPTDNSPAAADSTFPWWIIAAGIIIIGLITLGAFLALGGMSRPQSAAPQPQQIRSRPSAFK